MGEISSLRAGVWADPREGDRKNSQVLKEIWGGVAAPNTDSSRHAGDVNLMHFNKKTEIKKGV